MPKKYLKKIIPDRKKIIENKYLKLFGNFIHDPNLWHLNRRSVSRGFAIGLFFAWIPIPFQMLPAAAGAILFHANIALSVALVWLTNPITMPPLFFFAYKIGNWVMGTPVKQGFKFQLSFDWIFSVLKDGWKPFLLGSLICAIVSSILGYISIRLIWRYFIIKNWRKRKLRSTIN